MSVVAAPATRRPPVARSLEVYADIWCPFTHVGLRRLVAARDAKAPDLAIRVHAWPLEWINGRALEPEVVAGEIAGLQRSVAADLFAGFDPEHFPSTTIPALGLAATAYERGDVVGELVSMRLRTALFEEGRDLSDSAELHAIGRELGATPLAAEVAHAMVRADWERGRTRGVRGSPHFFAATRDWFCPSLRIRHDGSTFDVALDVDALDAFYRAIFR